jgi:hypothetical protein
MPYKEIKMLQQKNSTQRENFVLLQMFHFILFPIVSREKKNKKKSCCCFCFMLAENESRMKGTVGGLVMKRFLWWNFECRMVVEGICG